MWLDILIFGGAGILLLFSVVIAYMKEFEEEKLEHYRRQRDGS